LALVDQAPAQDKLVWSFWVAAGIAFVGGLTPLVFGGTSSRIAGAVVPFTIAAGAMAACALFNRQGRLTTALLYFVGGLAIVYGILAMFAIPLELAVLGSCPAPPAPCATGLGRPLTVGENTGTGFAAGFGLVALFVGFFGLMVVFRKPLLPVSSPPVRQIPPVAPAKPAATAATETKAAENGSAPQAVEEQPELPPHVEEELPELPPHESGPPT
jgi:hypothetical protein